MKWFYQTTITGLIALFLGACAKAPTEQQNAYTYFQGKTLFQQQKFSTAYPLLMTSAKRGNANAMYVIGYMQYNGLGVARDQTKALVWLQKAATLGNIRAIEALRQLDNSH